MERHFTVTGNIVLYRFLPDNFYLWPKLCDRCFVSVLSNAASGAPFSSNQKLFLPTVQHDSLNYYFILEFSSSPKPLFVLQHLFCSSRIAFFSLPSEYSKLMLRSPCHIAISIHSHSSRHNFTSLIPHFTVFYIPSGKEGRNLYKNI